MTRDKTPEETRAEYVGRMGGELGNLYFRLWQELAWLYEKWEQYVALYGTKPSRVDLLNKAAPLFFRIVQDTLWDDVLLHISRLTDPPKSGRRATLTIQSLPGLVEKQIGEALSQLVETAKNKAEFCRDWRNRRIAHSDKALALEERAKPLEPASRRGVKLALAALADVLNKVSERYLGSPINFEFPMSSNRAEDLLYVIDDGLKAAAEREDRIRRKEYRKEDLEGRDL